jgi:fibronectin-binding autotransporter adhesin
MRGLPTNGNAASKRGRRLLAAAAVGLAGNWAAATTLTWDPSQLNGASLGGSGTWNTSTTANWYTGSADTQWTDTTGVNIAVFNTSAGTVTIPAGGVAAGALSFSIGGYILGGSSQGSLTLGGSTPSITMTSGTGNTTIATSIAGSSTATLTVIGVPSSAGTTTAGQLILTNANSFSGNWVAQSTGGAYGSDVLQLNDASSTTATPVIVGNLQIGSSGSTGNGVGVVAAAANQFSSSSVITFYNGGSSFQYFNMYANQNLAGMNGAGTNGEVQIGANTDGTNYGGVTLTLDGSGNYAYSGTIRNYDSGGSAGDVLSLIKAGTGTQTLSNNDVYSGGTTISGGTLVLSGANALPSAGTLKVVAGGTLNLADGTARTSNVGGLTLAGGTLDLDWNAGSADEIATPAAATASGTVAIVLNPTNTPTGTNLTLVSAASGLTSGGASYFLANNTNYTATLGASDTAVTVSGYTSGTALTNAYWYGGRVTGQLNAMALSTGSVSNWSSAATYTATGLVPGSGATVTFSTTAGASQESSIVLGANMSVKGIVFSDTTPVTIANDGYTLTVGSGLITANQTATINEPTIIAVTTTPSELAKAASGATLTLGSVTVTGTNDTNVGDATDNGTIAITGALTIPNNKFLVNGGTLNYSGTGGSVTTNNNYFAVADGAAATMNITGGGLSANTGSSQFFIGNTSTGALNVSGGTLAWTGSAFEIGGDVTYGSTSGNGTLTVSGSGIVQLAGTSSSPITFGYKGATGILNLNGGTLQTAGSFVKETGSGTINFNGGTLQASGNNSNWIQGVTSKVLGGGSIIDTQSYAVTIGQSLVNGGGTDGGLTKIGSGSLTLSTGNTYNGGTTIKAGTLQAANASALGTGSVDVKGTIAVGADSTHPGLLNTNNAGQASTWEAGADYAWKTDSATGMAGTNFDQINMTSLNVTGSHSSPFTIILSDLSAAGGTAGTAPSGLAAGDSWVLATTSTTAQINGSNVTSGALLTSGLSSDVFALSTSNFDNASGPVPPSAFSLDFVANGIGGDNLVLTYNATPEPGTGVLALGGTLPLLVGRRRRRRITAPKAGIIA